MADTSIHPLLQLEQTLFSFRRDVRSALDKLGLRLTHVKRDELSEWDAHRWKVIQAQAAGLEGRAVELADLMRRIQQAKQRPKTEWSDAFVRFNAELVDFAVSLLNETEKR